MFSSCDACVVAASMHVVAVMLMFHSPCGSTSLDSLISQVILRWNKQRGIPIILEAAHSSTPPPKVEDMLTWRLSYEHKALLDRLEDGTRVLAPTWHVFADPEEGGAVKPRYLLEQQQA